MNTQYFLVLNHFEGNTILSFDDYDAAYKRAMEHAQKSETRWTIYLAEAIDHGPTTF